MKKQPENEKDYNSPKGEKEGEKAERRKGANGESFS